MNRKQQDKKLGEQLRMRRYSPDLCVQMATCDANYIRLLKLLPDMHAGTSIEVQIPLSGNNHTDRQSSINGMNFLIKIVESFKYTSTIEIVQINPKSTNRYFESPEMLIRVYHDASTAEVISYQHIRYFKSRYELANPHMHQPDEKQQLNVFLGEWLNLCISKGACSESVLRNNKSLDDKDYANISGVGA